MTRRRHSGLWKRAGWYWMDATVNGQRHRRPLKTRNWQEALQRKREEVDRLKRWLVESKKSPRRLFEAVEAYLARKVITCSERTVELERERLSVVKRHFGDVKLTAITGDAIAGYQAARRNAGISGRTINMDVGALRRVLKHCGRWRILEDQVQNLPEAARPIGRALTTEEQAALFKAAAGNAEWAHVYCAAIVAANTSLRPVEVKNLRWQDVDLIEGTVTVKRSKNVTSHRLIPLNQSARAAFNRMWERARAFGFTRADHYIWPASQWRRFDPTRPIKKWDTAWRSLREAVGLPGLRFHDLRHTIVTDLAEMGVPDHVLQSISGHLSRRMLEHYSHVRIEAKRKALEELEAWRERATQKASEQAEARIQ